MIVILHNIRSAHNVGSIFRTADAAGIEKIYCCGITPAPRDRFSRINDKLTKVSLGAEKYINWERIPVSPSPFLNKEGGGLRKGRVGVKQINHLFDKLKKQGWQILALEQDKNSVSLFNFELTKTSLDKTVLVLGNEIRGLPQAVLKHADKIIEIPMAGRKESLNVAVAFGIVVFWLVGRA